MYRVVLSRAGYACEFACDGKAALSAVRAAPEKFALVITDIRMPGMDGWSLIQHLVQMSFAGKILVVSASAAPAPETGPPHCAIDHVHAKPVTAYRLLSTVQALLGST